MSARSCVRCRGVSARRPHRLPLRSRWAKFQLFTADLPVCLYKTESLKCCPSRYIPSLCHQLCHFHKSSRNWILVAPRRDLIAVFKWEKSVFLKAIICCSYKKAWWSTLMQEDLKISRAGFRYTLKIISCLKGQPFPWILAHTSASRTDLLHKNCEQ